MRIGQTRVMACVGIFCLLTMATSCAAEDDKKHAEKAVGNKDHKGAKGEEHAVPPQGDSAGAHGQENPIFPFSPDLGLFTLALFLALVFLLRPHVWDPILAGLRKREESIKAAEKEALLARKEAEQASIEFETKRKEAYAAIPVLMENARKDAEKSREEIRFVAMAKIQEERKKLHEDVDAAKQQFLAQINEQAATLSALISAKAVGRKVSEEEHRRFANEAFTEVNAGGGKW